MDANTLFGPLGKDYCLYFYLLSVIGLVLLVLLFVMGIALGIRKKLNMSFYIHILTGCMVYAIFYFQNRLLYSMCINSA